jgi:transposase
MARKKDGRSYPDVALEAMRMRAIDAYRQGHSISEIARLHGLHRGSVSRWITRWRRGGKDALRRTIATGRPPKIDCEKYGRRILLIVKRSAMKYGYETPLWTCRRIKETLKKELKLDVTIPTVWRALKRLNLSAQKPERRALEQDPVRRKAWVENELPKIRALAKKEKALIFFEDEAAVRLTPNVGTTWAPVGKTPIVKVTGKRGTISVMSAVSDTGQMFFKLPEGTINSTTFIYFLDALSSEYPRRKIFVIADQASPHIAGQVAEYLETNKRLRLFYLPPYSPDFNPDEEVWNHLKNHELKAHQATDEKSLKKVTTKSLRRMSRRPSLVRSFFKDDNVT